MNFTTEAEQAEAAAEFYTEWAESHGWDPEDPETVLFFDAAMADAADVAGCEAGEAARDAR